jgi:hypothetical protein
MTAYFKGGLKYLFNSPEDERKKQMTLLDAKDEILKGRRFRYKHLNTISGWLDVNNIDEVELEPLPKKKVKYYAYLEEFHPAPDSGSVLIGKISYLLEDDYLAVGKRVPSMDIEVEVE